MVFAHYCILFVVQSAVLLFLFSQTVYLVFVGYTYPIDIAGYLRYYFPFLENKRLYDGYRRADWLHFVGLL
jgi:hypothetical protein